MSGNLHIFDACKPSTSSGPLWNVRRGYIHLILSHQACQNGRGCSLRVKAIGESVTNKNMGNLISLDWFRGTSTGKPHIWWEKTWFPVDVPLNQEETEAEAALGNWGDWNRGKSQ